MDLGLDGKVALVTAASQGIGYGIAKELAQEGAHVAVSSRTREKIEAAAAEIGARPYVHDTLDLDAAPGLLEAVERDLGPIDILVTNTGGPPGGNPLEFTREQWEAAHRELVVAAIEMIQLVVPGMRERGFGRILFTSSVAALTGGIIGPHYASSKAGLHGLTHFLASRAAPDGVTVNAIAPALIEDTGMLPGDPGELARLIPVGRVGRPPEVADLALAILRNAYLTNQVIGIDGGMHPR
jgi:3-oxoacyl-[acyl-carrier protein] reductase